MGMGAHSYMGRRNQSESAVGSNPSPVTNP